MPVVSRLTSSGDHSVTGEYDEYTLNNSNYGVSFNGGNQYLIAPSNVDFAFPGDFTIEGWFYKSSAWTNTFDFVQALGTNGISFYASSSTIRSGPNNVSSYSLGATTSLAINTWYHIAFVRKSNSARVYVNGVPLADAVSDTNSYAQTELRIGGGVDGSFDGYISNVRIIKGRAIYDPALSSFTLPNGPLTAVSNTVLLTCQSPTIIDNSINALTITNANASTISKVPTTFYKTKFSGASQYLRVPYSSAFDFSASNWTLECWFKANAFDLVILSKDTYGTNFDFCMYVSATVIFSQTAGTAQTYSVTTGLTLTTGKWYHLAMVRSAGTLNYYLDGVKYGAGSGMGITNVSNSYVTLGCFGWNNPSGFMNGSVSNLRMVQGTALYTSNFTPPTQQLTAISGTTFLTYQSPTIIDNSTNAITITNFNGVTVENPLSWNTVKRELFDGKFQTLGDIDEYTLSNGSSSNLYASYATSFNGSKYLTTSATPGVAAITTNFTVEFWMYVTGGAGTTRVIAAQWKLETGKSWIIYIGPADNLVIDWTNFLFGPGASSINLNTWYHVAWVRNGANMYGYLNGVQFGSSAVTTIPASSDPIIIGGSNDAASPTSLFTGYISNLRIVKGTAVYTSAFAPPTSPLTNITNTSLLTLQNSTIIDNSTANTGGTGFVISNPTSATTLLPSPNWNMTKSKLFSNGVFQVSSSFDEYTIPNNSYSVQFNGSSQYLTVPSNAGFSFGTGDFTVECWMWTAAFTNTYGRIIVDARPTGTNGSYWLIGLDSTSKPTFTTMTTGGATITGASSVATSTWRHIAVTRSSGTIRLFVDGVSAATAITGNADNISSSGLRIGFNAFATIGGFAAETLWNGYISNLRIIKGTALYTAAFTPPTSPLTTVSGTSLLTCQNPTIIDNSINAFTITNNNTATTTITVSPFI